MGQAFKSDDNERWLVEVGPFGRVVDVYNSRGNPISSGWCDIENHTCGRDGSAFFYARYATQDEIDAALRAESPALALSAPVDGWIEKSWGRTRQVFAAEGVEVWESEGKAGHRTSYHKHPAHLQSVSVVSGVLGLFPSESAGGGELVVDATFGFEVGATGPHELRFHEDCRFIEVYVGTGSVMDTIERIYK